MDKWETNFSNKLERLSSNNAFNKTNKKLVLEYIQAKKAENITCHRLNRVLDFLWHVLSKFNYDFNELSEERIDEIVI